MGNTKSVFTDEELEEYQELTFLTKKEILHIFDRFRKIDSEAVDKNRKVRLPNQKIMELDELKVNPFRGRICKVFSSDSDGRMSFEDFLGMLSVFSDAATKAIKIEYAFRIYDFNGDGLISSVDLKDIIDALTGEEKLPDDSMQHLLDNILTEADLDGDGALSFAEFQHVMSKSPDFVDSFRIRL